MHFGSSVVRGCGYSSTPLLHVRACRRRALSVECSVLSERLQTLPVDRHIAEVRSLLEKHRRLVIVAPPGSGKSTRVPPALVGEGRVVLLQPRRVAARSIARRIASEQGWSVGREIGWQIRFERRFRSDTRLLVATEGVLVRRLMGDPLLSDTTTVILDEFHERSIHADLSIALVKQAMEARADLRLVVMSATLDASQVATYLGGAPVLEIEGGLHPLDMRWAAGAPIEEAVADVLGRTDGDVLCFLPGVKEIREAGTRVSAVRPDVEVHELHGSLDVDAQESALRPSNRRKVILATNIAETSLTVEGVRAVIDSGLHRVLRYESGAGIDRLVTERIPRDSADQRAGRAGRLGPGIVLRLWDPRDELRSHREAEIGRIDLASTLLDVFAWGDDPSEFDWFESPDESRLKEDLALLTSIGALEGGRLTEKGKALQRLPVHPRLGSILLGARDLRAAARVCAIVSEGDRWAVSELDRDGLGADVRLLLERFDQAPFSVRQVAKELEDMAGRLSGGAGPDSIEHAILRGFPDRVARRRIGARERFLTSGGQGVVLSGGGVAPDSEWIVALDVRASDRGRQMESIVRLASPVDVEWLEPTSVSVETRMEGRRSRGFETRFYGSIAMSELQVDPDPAAAERLLGDALCEEGLRGDDERLARRVQFAGVDVDVERLMHDACAGRTELPRFRLSDWLPHEVRAKVDALAPDRVEVPSGRRAALDYRNDGNVVLSIKLQELFGLAESPRIGPERTPITIELLAPNGRPVQTTADLRSFWETTYQDVRKELRGRYPKHPWPVDPWTAEATRRTKRIARK